MKGDVFLKRVICFALCFITVLSLMFCFKPYDDVRASTSSYTYVLSMSAVINRWEGDYTYGNVNTPTFNCSIICTFTSQYQLSLSDNYSDMNYSYLTPSYDSSNSKWFIRPVDIYGIKLFSPSDAFSWSENLYLDSIQFSSMEGFSDYNTTITHPTNFYVKFNSTPSCSLSCSTSGFTLDWSFSSCNVNTDGVTSFSFYYDHDTIPWGSAYYDGNYYNSPLVFESFYIVVDGQPFYVPIEEKYSMFTPYVDISTSNQAYYQGYFVDTNNYVIRRYIQFSYVFDYLELPNDTEIDYIYFTARYTFTDGVSNSLNIGISVPSNKFIRINLGGFQNMGSYIATIENDFTAVDYSSGTSNNGNLNNGAFSYDVVSPRSQLIPTYSTDITTITNYVSGFFSTFSTLCTMAFSWIPGFQLLLGFLISGLVAICLIKALL